MKPVCDRTEPERRRTRTKARMAAHRFPKTPQHLGVACAFQQFIASFCIPSSPGNVSVRRFTKHALILPVELCDAFIAHG